MKIEPVINSTVQKTKEVESVGQTLVSEDMISAWFNEVCIISTVVGQVPGTKHLPNYRRGGCPKERKLSRRHNEHPNYMLQDHQAATLSKHSQQSHELKAARINRLKRPPLRVQHFQSLMPL